MNVRLLVFDDEVLSVAKSGAVWARIYFDLGDRAFPEKGWSDLAVAFATSWLEALTLTSAGSSRERVDFMDGPLAVDISLNKPGLVDLSFIYKDAVQYSAVARLDELLQNAISAGTEVVKICRRQGWLSDPDFPHLTASIEKGMKALTVLPGPVTG
jgi:hypothetical protein